MAGLERGERGGNDDGGGQGLRVGRRQRRLRRRHALHRDGGGERQGLRRGLGPGLRRRGRAQHGPERGLVAVGAGVQLRLGLGLGGRGGRGLHHAAQRVHGPRPLRLPRVGRPRDRRPYTKPKATVTECVTGGVRVTARALCLRFVNREFL